MEESKKYADMSYIDFIKNVLEIKLTKDQEVLVALYEENKTKKVEYINNPIYPYWGDSKRGIGEKPWQTPVITYGSGDSTNVKNLDNLICYSKDNPEIAKKIGETLQNNLTEAISKIKSENTVKNNDNLE